ncbi:MAG: molybdate ABC transporter substrate-binding protein [Candidatus Glassbacteria bacterium]|nr:molybdate ABC transporter substrate-binding protein [Candidatus Glassbacteria bacterium]
MSIRSGLFSSGGLFFLAAVLLLSTTGGCGSGGSGPGRTITVYAGAGTMTALEQISPLFTEHSGYQVDFEFASSGSLAKKIASGAPCDLYVSASRDWIDYLLEKKLLDARSVKTVAGSELVCVVPENSPHGALSPGELMRLERIAVGDPVHVPVGKYAAQALGYFGLWDSLSAAGKLVLAPTVSQALYLARRGEVEAAVVYLGDARLADGVKVAFSFPSGSHDPVEFLGAIVVAGRAGPAAKKFLDFLACGPAVRVFNCCGFTVP